MPKISIPEDFLCPITQELMADPVATADGQIYEREAIKKWLEEHDTSPLTNLKLKNKELTVIPFVKKQIRSFLEKANICSQKAFFEAVQKGDAKQLERMNYFESYLENRLDIENEEDYNADYFLIPLALAAKKGHVEIVKLLLAAGAKVEGQDTSFTPLYTATEKGHAEIVKLLLAAGANVKGQDKPLYTAVQNGHIEIVNLLLGAGANVDECRLYSTPLHAAAEKGHVEIVKLLLAAEANVEGNHKNWAPLCTAAENGHAEIVRLLLAANAHIEVQNHYARTPLCLAAKEGYTEVVKLLLLHKAKTNISDEFGQTPLIWAAGNGHVGIVKLLLAAGATLGRQEALVWAARNGHAETITLLLAANIFAETKNLEGQTLLSSAAQWGHTEAVTTLLEFDADIEARDDKYARTPLHWASMGGYTPVTEIFKASEPMCLRAEDGCQDVVKILLAAGADIEAKDAFGQTPLQHYAAAYGSTAIAKILLEHGASYNALNDDNETPMDVAEKCSYPELSLFISETHKKLKIEIKKTPSEIARLEKIIRDQQALLESQQKTIEQLTRQMQDLEQKLSRRSPPPSAPGFSFAPRPEEAIQGLSFSRCLMPLGLCLS